MKKEYTGKITGYTAWICSNCEDANCIRVYSKTYPNTHQGVVNAIDAVLLLKVEYPNWEWGVYFDADGGWTHYDLFHGCMDELMKTRAKCIRKIAELK